MKKNMKIGFSILHYGSNELTVKCYKSIEELAYENKEIVIVDNCSGTLVDDCYSENVHIIKSKNNLGFAKGNNLGFEYLRQCQCDFILLLNNDTYFVQQDFCQKMLECYKRTNFAVAGPLILDKQHPYGSYDNPGIMNNFTLHDLNKMKRTYYLQYLLLMTGLYNFCVKVTKKDKKLRETMESKNNTEECSDTVLNGCALIFSSTYIGKMGGLDDRTYMYMEEFILYEHVVRNGLHTYFFPQLKIFHNHEGATNTLYNSERRKKMWQLKNTIKSLKILEQVIAHYDDQDS